MKTILAVTPPAAAGLLRAGNFLIFGLLCELILSPVFMGWMRLPLIYELLILSGPTSALIMYLGVRAGVSRFADARTGDASDPASPTIEASARQVMLACAVGVAGQLTYLFIVVHFIVRREFLFTSNVYFEVIYIVEALAFAAAVLLLVKICREVSRTLSRGDLVRVASWLYPILAVVIFGSAFFHYDRSGGPDDALELAWLINLARFVVLLFLVGHIRHVVRAMSEGSQVPAAVVR